MNRPVMTSPLHNGSDCRSEIESATPSSSRSDIAASSEFAEELLQRHNELRKRHGSRTLKLSHELSEMAEDWALKIARKQHLSYSELTGVGENITVFPLAMTAKEMVDYWYRENRKYEYETPGWQSGTNYFTQLIWKETREVGVGRAKLRSTIRPNGVLRHLPEEQVVVCFYRPAGNNNRAGQFSINVTESAGPVSRQEMLPQ